MKEVNYKVGAAKRRFGIGRKDFEPGTLISKMNEQKMTTKKEFDELPEKTSLAIRGLI